MGHAAIENQTPLALLHHFLADEDGRPLLVVLAQATYTITSSDQPLQLADEQPLPSLEGELWGEDANVSSYKIEPAFAFTKPSTDVVLVGHAVQPYRPQSDLSVIFRVGPVAKTLRIVGDRVWTKSAGAITPTSPRSFERMPLIYERAFGGWDKSPGDPARFRFDPRNPVGRGFRTPDSPFEEGVRLPNIEDPGDPVRYWGQSVRVAGVGFTSPNWQPRSLYAGTYDEAWQQQRMPLLPKDFDRRFFNSASPGLVAPMYLLGNEPVLIENASALGRLSFYLPGLPPPACTVELSNASDAMPELNMDTVVVDTEKNRLLLLFRGYAALRDGPHDVKTIKLEGI